MVVEEVKQARTQSGGEHGPVRKRAKVKVRLKEMKNDVNVILRALMVQPPYELVVMTRRIHGTYGYTVHKLVYYGHPLGSIVAGQEPEARVKVVEDFCKQIKHLRPELRQWG